MRTQAAIRRSSRYRVLPGDAKPEALSPVTSASAAERGVEPPESRQRHDMSVFVLAWSETTLLLGRGQARRHWRDGQNDCLD